MNLSLTKEEYPDDYERYISLVSEGNVVDHLAQQLETTISLLSLLTETQANFRYAPEKWSVKEVIGHITDTERIMSYRLLRLARGDQTPLAGFDQDPYVQAAGFALRALPDLLEDFTMVRRSTLTLLRGLQEEAWMSRGIVNDHYFSVRALAYIIAGHELYHVKLIKEKYFP